MTDTSLIKTLIDVAAYILIPLKTVSSSTRAGLSETRGLTEAGVAELFRRMVNPAVIREGWD